MFTPPVSATSGCTNVLYTLPIIWHFASGTTNRQLQRCSWSKVGWVNIFFRVLESTCTPFHHTCHQVLYMKPSFLCLGRYQAQSIWRGRLARVAAESGAAASKLRRNAHGLHHRRQHFANATLRAAMQLPFTISRRCRERRWDFHKINFNSHYDQIRYVVQ